MIRPETLRNPEQGLQLEDREPLAHVPDPKPEDEPELEEPSTPPSGQPSLRERIATARRLEARPEEGCRDCWTHGRDAALAALGDVADGRQLRVRLGAARVIAPSASELHWRACWERGRDAALAVIEGE